MVNIAVIVAVSKYGVGMGDLPACANDAVVMRDIVKGSGRFDEILVIDQSTLGSKVKNEIAEAVDHYKTLDVEELLFYFTGHGQFTDNELYYLLSDYDPKKPRQTSLSNSEIDEMVRALNPALYVKIIDACHSGVSYIKSSDNIETYLKSTKAIFQKLYFMFSSQNNQFSYQNERLSFFTDSIRRSIVESMVPVVRYKDVIAFVSDDFAYNGVQTPLFITQADFTERFLTVTGERRNSLAGLFVRESNAMLGQGVSSADNLVAILKKEAERYCTEEQAYSAVSALPMKFEEAVELGTLQSLFRIEVNEFGDEFADEAEIGSWLEQYGDDSDYFCEPQES